MLSAFLAISAEFVNCKKFSNLNTIPNRAEIKNFKLNDNDFSCVYGGILKALEGPRYPTKAGKEYTSLVKLLELLEAEHLAQRRCKFTYNNRMQSDAAKLRR